MKLEDVKITVLVSLPPNRRAAMTPGERRDVQDELNDLQRELYRLVKAYTVIYIESKDY